MQASRSLVGSAGSAQEPGSNLGRAHWEVNLQAGSNSERQQRRFRELPKAPSLISRKNGLIVNGGGRISLSSDLGNLRNSSGIQRVGGCYSMLSTLHPKFASPVLFDFPRTPHRRIFDDELGGLLGVAMTFSPYRTLPG